MLGSPPGARDGQSGQVKTSLRSQCLIFTIFTRLVNFTSPLRSSAQTTQVWLDPHNAPRHRHSVSHYGRWAVPICLTHLRLSRQYSGHAESGVLGSICGRLAFTQTS